MSQQRRILVVEGDEQLNRNVVGLLQKEGYRVQGVATGAEAIQVLWAQEHHLVISDQKLPDTDGFSLLHWLRTYCPATRMMMLASSGAAPGTRTQALESGVVAYLEAPVDPRLLKVEVRRLLQQTGFTASLDSFDLLDVIQIINMSRKDIALVVHTGLEEQGLLGFNAGELIWAEYGILRGEEAFFALAAHKNGTVTQQPWNAQIVPNVTQPLSRLILQALQYRSKYAITRQSSGEFAAANGDSSRVADAPSPLDSLLSEEYDDRPFSFVEESPAAGIASMPTPVPPSAAIPPAPPSQPQTDKEWWQESSKFQRLEQPGRVSAATTNARTPSPSGTLSGGRAPGTSNGTSITPSTVRKTTASQRVDLPSWLMDQPTQFDVPAVRSTKPVGTGSVPVTPVVRASLELEPPLRQNAVQVNSPDVANDGSVQSHPASGTAEWQLPVSQVSQASQPVQVVAAQQSSNSGPLLQSLALPRKTDDLENRSANTRQDALNGAVASPGSDAAQQKAAVATASTWEPSRVIVGTQRASRRNYPALVSALQTLGYSLPGFVASAVVSMDGQPVAQVAIDDLDIAPMCSTFSTIVQSALLTLKQGNWGTHEDTILTSSTHHIILRVLGSQEETFQVLVTTRESDPVESLDIMASVEGSLIAAL